MEQPVRKKRRDANSAISETDDTGQSCESSELDLSVYLTYDVLRLVFQYLKARDLSSAAMVCRFWSEAANNERCTRGPIYFIKDYTVSSQVIDQIRDLYIKPRIGFLFFPRATERLEGHINKVFPPDCEILVFYAAGIIINNEEMENYRYPKVVCTFLPEIPDVTINTYQVTKQNANESMPFKKLGRMICPASELNHKTCLMLFCNYSGRKIIDVMIPTIKRRHDSKIGSVWGGVVDMRHMQNSYWKVPFCIAVLISGAIQTWSTVIDVACNTNELIEKKLKLFKERIKLKKHSVGFMFACTARGKDMHAKGNMESTIFKTFFPSVPLVGCFGDGEFGKDSDMDDKKEETSLKPKRRRRRHRICLEDTWSNEYSTVFMILTYG